MLPLAYYLLKVIICSGILFGYYWLLLRNKVFHKYNRFYLMASVVLSLLLPLIKISVWQLNTTGQSSVIKVLQVVSNSDEYMDTVVVSSSTNSFDATQLYPFAYLLVSLILLIVFLHTLYVIATLLKKYPKQTIESVSFINTDAKSTPFSFLKYIFWNHNIDMETTTGNQIFKHELAHVQEGHTYDKLFINLVLICFWCNPFYWLYRKELNMIHEFIADKKAVEDSDTAAFAAMILQATYPQHRFQLTNNFFYSPVKRRLLMLTKNKNPKVNYFGRIMVLPLLVLIFAAFTFKVKSGLEAGTSLYNGKKIVVVIDPGHGGKYVGAQSKDGILEKDLTLAIAKEIKALNTNEAIDIILTKETDTYLTKEQKNAFATAHNAAIYITVHTGATATVEEKEYHLGDPMDEASGLKIIIGDDSASTFLQSKLLGSAIADEFSGNYPLPVSHQLVQRRLYTMKNNNCPSVYVEAGLMTNKKDLDFLVSKEGKTTIAKNILAAINKFAIANLQNNTAPASVLTTTNFSNSIYINAQHSDTSFLKTNAFKTKALVIVDQKQIGNLGYNYVESSTGSFSSVVIYNPEEAQKNYGLNGRYGAIKLTSSAALCISSDSFFIDKKNNSLKLSLNASTNNEGLDNALIYVDGKISTPAELQAISPGKINSVNILKGDNLADIADAKGKTSVINVTLKTDPLAEVTVTNFKPKPLYVIDEVVQPSDFNINTIAPNEIERIDVLKGQSAITKYGDKGNNGVVEITLKKAPAVQQLTIKPGQAKPLYIINGKLQENDAAFKLLNPNAIESINVLKDTAAINKYGDKGKNGVIEIVTKRNTTITLKYPQEITEAKVQGDNNKVFTKVEVASYYAEGNDAWKKYLQYHLHPDIPVAEGWKAGTYTIVVQFIIRTDGSVSDVTTTNYQGSKTAQHCIDLVKQSGKWVPAVQNGRPVNAYRKQPITFLITEEDVKKSITEIYSVPLKVHLWNEGKVNTYNMAGNGAYAVAPGQLYIVNGKLASNPAAIKKETVSAIESYDGGAGKLVFGNKGKNGVMLITTKS